VSARTGRRWLSSNSRAETLRSWSARTHIVRRSETHYPEAGSSHLDGPDGAWLYFHAEEFARRPGHVQLARIPAEGGRRERLVESETFGWFPHLSLNDEWRATSAFRPAHSGIYPTWTWRCGWFALQIGATSPAASRSSVGREPLKSTAGRRTVTGRFRGVSEAAVVITMTTPGVIAISMQGAKQWKDSGA
jgi:hypothetical protein